MATNKILKSLWTWIIFSQLILFCIVMIFKFSATYGGGNEFGDVIGGIIGPFINLATGVLLFFTFKSQERANQHEIERLNTPLISVVDIKYIPMESHTQPSHCEVTFRNIGGVFMYYGILKFNLKTIKMVSQSNEFARLIGPDEEFMVTFHYNRDPIVDENGIAWIESTNYLGFSVYTSSLNKEYFRTDFELHYQKNIEYGLPDKIDKRDLEQQFKENYQLEQEIENMEGSL